MPVFAKGQITIRIATDNYAVYQSVDKAAISCDHTGKVSSPFTLNSIISVHCGDSPVTDFIIGAISKPAGFSSITTNHTTKTITYSINTGDTTLADTGTIAVPVTVDGQRFTASFVWYKVKAGSPGADSNMLDWVTDWNSDKTIIDSQSVITPKIFAGTQNANGTVTGIAVGKFSLGTRNASGVIAAEFVNGIYGFNDGTKTFFVDATGSAQLGNGNEYVRYNAATGKIEFGSAVSLNWVNAINKAKAEAINTASSDAATKVNAIKIGSRNYIRNSAFMESLTEVTTDGTTVSIDTVNLYNGYRTLKVVQSAACTDVNAMSQRTYFSAINNHICSPGSFSMYVRGNVAGSLKIRLGGHDIQIKPVSTTWQRIVLENITPNSNVVLFGFSVADTFWCALPMLVEGSKAADWSPAPEDMESSITDAKKTGTDARSVADAITNKATTEGWTTKLTYIDKNGIFTGTLSANTVNAVRINASQIAVGTIDTARLNTEVLKTTLITAGNIEALTLNVTKGTMGGWSLDADSIFRGTKNNTAGAYTAASGAITIGSDGIRGYKWRLDSAGSGSVAGNNITWDTAGNVTFSSAVSLLWKNAATNAANSGKLYVRGTGMNHHAPRKIMLNGSVIHESNVRGLALTVITRDTLTVSSTAYYDVYASESVCDTLANALNALEADKIVVLSSCDSIRINDNLNTAIQRCGGADVTTVIARVPFALIGIPGIGKNNGVFAHYGQGAAEPYAELSTLIINGTPQGISVNGQRNTFIDGNGIYTGTLNANQITAGIIDTERLDAASIRTNIINTGYINGLNCTFVRGKIGGFTIENSSVSIGNIGNIGEKALQIRSAPSGSGSWFSGSYKPFGVSMVWHQTNNAGHIVFGEVAASGSTVRNGFIGLQMMSWDGNEYFCLSADCSLSGRKEVYNRIAGWAFDNRNIWKNNVSLGADGSIVNGTKWRLNNDGSGQVANGNIIWDTAGNVTFGASVSLNWANAATNALNSAKSYAEQKKTEAINSSATDATSKANAAKELASAMAFGKMLYRDPTFTAGMNGISILNSLPNGMVILERIRDESAPNDSKMVLKINSKGVTLPGCGGFTFLTEGSCQKIFITRFIAKIPVGHTVQFIGTVASVKWLTANAGTGEWQEYVLKAVCTVASSTLNSFYIEGDAPLTWQLAYATVFDVTSSEGYTTTIDANGIYTASLNAGQITAGTIDTNRLDAATIKSNIINTNYINGLSCTFTKGKIGGFTIGNNNITSSGLGSTGTTPLQIRTASSGTGNWFAGAYKPFGITLTWFQSSNAGHISFGEIAATCSSVKTGFIGIQMMTWDSAEYFCLSANYTTSGVKEIYNRIAGWAFDNQNIHKNNVYLGSDGSVYNGTKWRLNNDGSGRLANGNIVWDAVGKVTFGPEVSLNWTNAAANALNSAKSYADEKKTEAVNSSAADSTLKADAAKELASAMAGGKMLYRDPTFNQGLNGIKVYNVSGNGTVTISRMRVDFAPNDSNMVLEIKTKGSASPGCGGFGFETAASYRKVFIVRFIANIPPGKAVQFFTNSIGSGGSSKWLTRNIGMGDWQEFVYKVSCGIDNFSTTNFFYIEGTGNISWQLAYATVFDVTSAEGYTTTIDANGIYTASLNAGQITAGTISADRLSAGSINASKLDAASIKASIINTAYINGLNCTFTKGVVGGWKIAAGSITASNSMPGHTVSINSAGYLYNSDGSTNYWALNPDGSAVFGKGKIGFNADGSGKLASGNIVWDVSGNVTMTGKINANSGTIGGFKISTGWIGSTATASGTGGGLALYDNFLRVGYLTSYAMFGENTFPSGIGGYGISTGRITNEKSNPVGTNYGLYIDVRNGYKNCAVSANAPIVGSAVYGNKIKNIYFTSTAYTLDFSQNNIFFVYANQTLVITLPAASAVAKMFGYSALPSDFAYVFTFIYNYSYGNTLFFQNIRGFDGKLFNASMNGGDVLCLMIANFPDFHYQLLWKGN